jgi:glutamyl-tRNA synthetase
LFNWLFAKHEGGTVILRVEDTDLGRNKPELVDGILESLRWLGVQWDEGPFFQSQRLDMYREAAQKILKSGFAYLCYCKASQYAGADVARATEVDDEGDTETKVAAREHCGCRDLSVEEREAKERGGEAGAIRFKVPREGVTKFEDAVFGSREVRNEEIEDFVLLRSNGLPTYQLGAVVDDIDMRITHIIRGADHLSNTPKQVMVYEALGTKPPIFAHVPLILGPDRTRLSKRHGATSVGSYTEEGFLPEAFRNFLALLGWSPGDDSEYMTGDELISRFSLSGVSRTNAVFDRAKLEWFNSQYLQKMPIEELLPYVRAQLQKEKLWRPEWEGAAKDWFARAVDLIRPRTRFVPDFTSWARAFFTDDFDYEQAARDKFWKDEKVPTLLEKLVQALTALPEWNHDACDHALRQVAADGGVKAGVLINATRVAIVGRAVAPPLFDTMVVLGREKVISRIKRALLVLAP